MGTQVNKWPCRGEPTPFIEPANFILNVAVGGSFFGAFPPMDPSTWIKPSMEIDWVRVYQTLKNEDIDFYKPL